MLVERGKLERVRRSVNFPVLAAAAVAVVACGPPLRPTPPIDPRGDWPTLLGNPQRSGYASETVPAAPEEAWRANVGRGLLTPVLVEGPVLIASTANRMVVTLNTETGERYWGRRLAGAVTGGVVRGGQRIFAATDHRDGKAYALGLERGRTAWDRTIGPAPFPGLIVEDAVYFVNERGRVFALGTDRGEERWRVDLPGAPATTPVPHGESLLIATTRDTLYRIERGSGRIQARVKLPATVSAAPTVVEDTVYLPLQTGDVAAYQLPGLEELWRASFGAPILAAPVVGPDGALYVLNRNTDLWRVRPGARAGEKLASLDGAARASLAVTRDRLLVGRLDGKLFLLDMDGRVLWERDFEDSIVAPVTVADGAIFVPLLRGTIVKLR